MRAKLLPRSAKWIANGEIAVGFIVFLILVVVQFIVITKGSERVAEVAARFTLDAMPGKQMSIDADLNAGLINEQQAGSAVARSSGKPILRRHGWCE